MSSVSRRQPDIKANSQDLFPINNNDRKTNEEIRFFLHVINNNQELCSPSESAGTFNVLSFKFMTHLVPAAHLRFYITAELCKWTYLQPRPDMI